LAAIHSGCLGYFTEILVVHQCVETEDPWCCPKNTAIIGQTSLNKDGAGGHQVENERQNQQ